MRTARSIHRPLILCMLVGLYSVGAYAQTTAFSYQGSLTDNGTAANGSYQFRFRLFDAVSGGAQIGPTIADVQLAVSAGIFSTKLDFGASPLSGANRFLEIAIRRNAGESYVTLTPREQIASSPYAVRTLLAAQAEMAADSEKLGGVDASEYLTNTSLGNSVIRNQSTLQSPANFNISGNGVIGGNFGIGITEPTSRLDILGQNALRITGFQPFITFQDTNADENIGARIQSADGKLIFRPGTFFTNIPAMIMNPNGSVGVGTSSPGGRLHVVDVAANALRATSSSGFAGIFEGRVQVQGPISGPDPGLQLLGGPLWTSAGWRVPVSLENASAIAWTPNIGGWRHGIGQSGGGLYFFQSTGSFGTNTTGASYNMIITDSGRVGILTNTPDQRLSVNGNASKTGGGSWLAFSDERLKTIKGSFTPGLEAVMQLKPIRFEYSQDNELGLRADGEQIGFRAQAVERVLPEAVIKNDNGYLLVNNDPIIWAMLNAIKEQQAQIELQQKQIRMLSEVVCDLRPDSSCREKRQ